MNPLPKFKREDQARDHAKHKSAATHIDTWYVTLIGTQYVADPVRARGHEQHIATYRNGKEVK